MNSDGAPDVVTIVAATRSDDPAAISVMLNANDGAATMLPPRITMTAIDSADGPAIAAGDVNRDGFKDIVVTQQYGSNPQAQLFLGRNDGSFQPPTQFALSSAGQPSLVDVSGDGLLDLVLAGQITGGVIYFGTGGNAFVNPITLSFPPHAIGDVNGDGRPDFVGHYFRDTTVAINNGNGTAFSITTLPDGDYAGVGALKDIDGDGRLDIFMLQYSGSAVRFGHGDGTFGDSRYFDIRKPIAESGASGKRLIRMGDFDGDGELDVVRNTRFYHGHGDGTFDGFAEIAGQTYVAFDVADFDGNGTDDLALATGDLAVSIIRTRLGPDPTLTAGVSLTASPLNTQYATAVKYSAEVHGGMIPPTGAVVFARNGAPFTMLTLDALAPGDDLAAAQPAGHVTVTATYTGDDHYAPATAAVEHQIAKAPTSIIRLSAPATPCGFEVRVPVSLQAPRALDLPGPSVGLTFREGTTPLQARTDQFYAYIANLGIGTHPITVEFAGDANYEPSSAAFNAVVTQSINATISVNAAGEASTLDYDGATYVWTISNGTIVSGQGTSTIHYVAGPSGDVVLGVTITRQPCSNSATRTVSIVPPRRRAARH
ncbi:MAG TPA: FG-GAP-like repeat-containing protein [Vicinamibacterales bacterium]|jgi:hypothetical protein